MFRALRRYWNARWRERQVERQEIEANRAKLAWKVPFNARRLVDGGNLTTGRR